MTPSAEIPEFSHTVPLGGLVEGVTGRYEVAATKAECEALAKRLGLQELNRLSAVVTIDRRASGEVLVRGHLIAEAVQTCVVTLDPLPVRIDEGFDVHFTTVPEAMPEDLVIGPDDEEPAEFLTGDTLDIGELTAQQLALALDPWPRKPDSTLPDEYSPDKKRDGPFAALADWGQKSSN